MIKKDFSKIAARLKTNGVGFVKLFFRSNQNAVELNEDPNTKEWVVDFSDGKKYLGSIQIDPDCIDTMSGKDTERPYIVESSSFHVDTKWERDLNIEFYFKAQHETIGECLIFE